MNNSWISDGLGETLEMDRLTNTANLAYVEELYAAYLKEPSAVPSDWQSYFAKLENSDGLRPSVEQNGKEQPIPAPLESTLQDQLNAMIHAYRTFGHRVARIDPLNLRKEHITELDPEFFGFTGVHIEKLFPAEFLGLSGPRTLREIVQRLKTTYCGSIGIEFMHIEDASIRHWLQERIERDENRLALSRAQRLRIFTRLTDAVTFEEFLRKKFVGAKSFSLEGAESLLPLLDFAIEKAAQENLQEIVLAMAHRGRLNVLANIIGKRRWEIFREFEDPASSTQAVHGDVKYHLGYSNDYQTASGRMIHLSLCFNPSHLEFVDPVAVGRMRAKQDRVGDKGRQRGMVFLIHGDASFAGEGVVQETLNLSRLDAYSVGGTLHVIINNQIGFTTAPEEGRSSTYATDVAKMLETPIFHVNGNDPEAVARAVQLAMDFRHSFKRDVVVDMYCYRRFGHNEGDEPTFTQPALYRAIAKQKPLRQAYLQQLLAQGDLTQEAADKMVTDRRDALETELALARREDSIPKPQSFGGLWSGYYGGPEAEAEEVGTAVEKTRLTALLTAQTRLPANFTLHPKLERAVQIRRQMAEGKKPLDWSAGEALAFASLATEGVRIRLSGQDAARGTFSQRHAVLHDFDNGRLYIPLQHLSPEQAPVEIYNSPLSEAGVLGFEYGYSLDCPDGLVLWEAQFGDFVNAAQVIIDQFITTAEEKWRRLSGVVLLLPHGLEGLGPEHSSARMERFLQLGAIDNIQVVYPTTPAQYFHCLRRQALRKWRKPLVIMTPKSLLRHPHAVSSLEGCAEGRFQPIIPDGRDQPKSTRRVILCAGKVYYDLDNRRREASYDDVAILRIEQLYPLQEEALRAALERYGDNTPVFWVQEEPENMGAWPYLNGRFRGKIFDRRPLSVICRQRSASPATGSSRMHREQQSRLLTASFAPDS
ncbi:MAG: 2-oxoglutarate dehydrogenase E1 component [Candidatus Binatia bacterium]